VKVEKENKSELNYLHLIFLIDQVNDEKELD
jgi:hypothetical protein